jgi:hypothetical protein
MGRGDAGCRAAVGCCSGVQSTLQLGWFRGTAVHWQQHVGSAVQRRRLATCLRGWTSVCDVMPGWAGAVPPDNGTRMHQMRANLKMLCHHRGVRRQRSTRSSHTFQFVSNWMLESSCFSGSCSISRLSPSATSAWSPCVSPPTLTWASHLGPPCSECGSPSQVRNHGPHSSMHGVPGTVLTSAIV